MIHLIFIIHLATNRKPLEQTGQILIGIIILITIALLLVVVGIFLGIWLKRYS